MKIAIIAATFIWIGLILGVSFLEAPLKFRAPNITTELGLGIGKLVFTALNRVEILTGVLIIVGLVMGKYPNSVYYFYVFSIGNSFATNAVATACAQYTCR